LPETLALVTNTQPDLPLLFWFGDGLPIRETSAEPRTKLYAYPRI
jgi:hypothetical protein